MDPYPEMPARYRPTLMREKNSKGRIARKPKNDDGRGMVPNIANGRLDTTYNAYLANLDPKGKTKKSTAVRYALAACPDSRFREFLVKMSMPRYRHYTLATIAKTCDISLAQFGEFWQKAQHARAVAIAQEGMAEVTSDMVDDARTVEVPCDRCDGFGFVYTEDGLDARRVKGLRKMGDRSVRPCPTCSGARVIRRIGDQESRKNLMVMAGHAGRSGGGAGVQINFGSMESAVEKMSRITFNLDDEAEVVEVRPTLQIAPPEVSS